MMLKGGNTMPSPIQNMETRLTAIETKIDQILAQPSMPPEVNLTQLTEMLGLILSNTSQILSYIQPTQPDLNAQAQQALAQLQAIQTQLQQQAQQIVIPEPIPDPEPIVPE